MIDIPTSSDVAALLRESEQLQARTDYMLNSALFHLGTALADVKEARAIIKELLTALDFYETMELETHKKIADRAKDFILKE